MLKKLVTAAKLQFLDPVSRRVKTEKLTYLSHSKLRSLNACLKELEARDVVGDFFDLGIALGGSSIILAKAKGTRRFSGYDVFGMIPPPGDADAADTHERYKVITGGRSKGIDGDVYYYGYDAQLYDRVVANFASFDLDVDGEDISLHKGLFEDTLKLSDDDRVALVHIDCDWHDPVQFCLQTVAPYLSKGGLIIVDDYNDYEGCRKATNEFLATNPSFRLRRSRPHAIIERA